MPPSGRTTPPTMFISVLLPAPFWPIRPRTRPRPSARLTSRTAWTPANAFDTPASSRIGVAHATLPLASSRRARHVERGGGEDDAALDHVDVEGREAHVVERVAEEDEEDDADERPDDLALAAGEAGAADDGGADDVEEGAAGADRRAAAAEPAGVEDRRDGGAQSGKRRRRG